MIRRKRDPGRVVASCIERIYRCNIKLRTARNIIKRARARRFDDIAFVSALYGIPFTSREMANLYINSSIKDLKKTYRVLDKLRAELREKDPPRYIAVAGELEKAIEKLGQLINTGFSIDMYIAETMEVYMALQTVYNKLHNRMPAL